MRPIEFYTTPEGEVTLREAGMAEFVKYAASNNLFNK